MRVVEIARTQEMQDRLLKLNVALIPQTTVEMARHLDEDMRRLRELIELTGIKAE